jgi:hypothetical protein
MPLSLVVNDNTRVMKYTGKRYRRDYDELNSQKELYSQKKDLLMNIEELIKIEKMLTLIEEKENKKKERLVYDKFLEALRLKRNLKYGY